MSKFLNYLNENSILLTTIFTFILLFISFIYYFITSLKHILNMSFFEMIKPSFVKPFFTSVEKEQKVLTFKIIWKNIISNSVEKNPLLFIYSEAGMGKTTLLEYVDKKLRIKNYIKSFKSSSINDVFYARFREYKSISLLVEQIKKLSAKYILLDGFDEFAALKTYDDATLLFDEFFNEIDILGSKISKIIITSRLELFKNGEIALRSKSTIIEDNRRITRRIPIEIVEIKHSKNRQIIKIFKHHISKEKGFIRGEDNKKKRIKILEKRNTIKTLKKYLKKKKDGNNIFRNAFFATKIDIIFKYFNIKNIDTLTFEQTLDAIIDDGITKEYNLLSNQLKFIEETETSEDEFKDKMYYILDDITNIMLKSNVYSSYIHNNKLPKKYLHYINTRALLLRKGEQLEFIHNLIFEYFIARNLQKLDYEKKKDVLKREDRNSIIEIYACLILKNDKSLTYKSEHLKNAIDYYEDHNKYINDYNNISALIKSSKIILKENAILHVHQIIGALPLVREIQYNNYTFKDDSINNIINIQSLIDYIESSKIWIDGSTIFCFNLIKYMSIMSLYININSNEQLEELVSYDNIKLIRLNVVADVLKTIEIYKNLCSIIKIKKNITIYNAIKLNKILEILEYYEKQVSAKNKAELHETQFVDFIIEIINNIIEFLDNVYEVQLYSGFNEKNEDMLLLKKYRNEEFLNLMTYSNLLNKLPETTRHIKINVKDETMKLETTFVKRNRNDDYLD